MSIAMVNVCIISVKLHVLEQLSQQIQLSAWAGDREVGIFP